MFKKNEITEEPFIIAEVGQNHQGDLELARKYIKIFAAEGADAVKFQTRNNKKLFSEDAYCKTYESENAFGVTYGEHREALELKPEWIKILKEDCHKYGTKFMSTPFDEDSLDLLLENDVDILKVASFDIGNLPLINRIAKSMKPIVISIGGGQHEQIKSSVELILKYNKDVSILHCVSEYPCEYNRLGLENIEFLIKEFPDCTIGSSDHFNGTLSGPVAYMRGARVFEKHVTLNRAWKGTDHSFALEQEGFRKFVRDLRRVRHMMPVKPKDQLGKEFVFQKLGKSIVALKDIQEGESLTLDNLTGRIFNQTIIPVRESNSIIGKTTLKFIKAGDPITFNDIK
jgi:N-acetylneuraminate synthase/sialic acid synthase